MQIFRNFYRQKVDFFEWPVVNNPMGKTALFPLNFLYSRWPLFFNQIMLYKDIFHNLNEKNE